MVVDFTNGLPFFSLFLDTVVDFFRICKGLRKKSLVHSIEFAEFYLGPLAERIVSGIMRIQTQDIRRFMKISKPFSSIDTSLVNVFALKKKHSH